MMTERERRGGEGKEERMMVLGKRKTVDVPRLRRQRRRRSSVVQPVGAGPRIVTRFHPYRMIKRERLYRPIHRGPGQGGPSWSAALVKLSTAGI